MLAYGGFPLSAGQVVDGVLGRSLLAQIISVGLGITAATLAYAWLVLALRIPEARQIQAFVQGRLERFRGIDGHVA